MAVWNIAFFIAVKRLFPRVTYGRFAIFTMRIFIIVSEGSAPRCRIKWFTSILRPQIIHTYFTRKVNKSFHWTITHLSVLGPWLITLHRLVLGCSKYESATSNYIILHTQRKTAMCVLWVSCKYYEKNGWWNDNREMTVWCKFARLLLYIESRGELDVTTG
jgi:hypothetical protein